MKTTITTDTITANTASVDGRNGQTDPARRRPHIILARAARRERRANR